MFGHSHGHSNEITMPSSIVERYEISRDLGSGAFGVVKLIYDRQNRNEYAMKIIKMRQHNSNVMNEMKLLQELNHPCIIKSKKSFISREAFFIIMEYMPGGTLSKFISGKRLSDSVTKFIFRQLVSAVRYLHSKNITHRDLKPDNILMKSSDSENPLVKIADFGISKHVCGHDLLITNIGDPNYIAPEVRMSGGNFVYTSKVDVWSLGLILYKCLTGVLPFTPHNHSFHISPQHWAIVNENAKSLITQMLQIDPNVRIRILKIYQTPWMQDEQVERKFNEMVKQC